jgi:hypothetical protein
MSASIHDIALSITSNGEKSYYCGVKGIGSILLEPKLGLYDNHKHKSDTALDFLKHTSWRDAYKKLSTPLADPIYGLIDINFDTKTVNFATDYGIPNFMFFQWLLHSTKYAVTKNKKEYDVAFLSPLAIKEHFKHQRFEFHGMGKIGHYPIHLQYPDTLEEFATLLQTEEARRFNDENKITQIIVKLPEDWLFEFPIKE